MLIAFARTLRAVLSASPFVIATLMATPASAAGSIYYGSRVGMEVTITSMSGIGGTNAIIRAVHTRANARTFCLEYARDSSEACIREELSTRLSDHIAANCKSGVFTTFYGETLRFLGPNKNSDFGSPKYKLVSLASGRPLDGSSASGYSYDIEQFSALCPGLIEPEQ